MIGFACGDSIGAWRLPATDDLGIVLMAVLDQLVDYRKIFKPSVIVVTGPVDDVDSDPCPDIAIRQISIMAVIKLFAARRGLRVLVPGIGFVRKAMLGRDDLSPDRAEGAARSFARRRGLGDLQPDAAHAFVLAEFSKQRVS
jgi:hypothetical protein